MKLSQLKNIIKESLQGLMAEQNSPGMKQTTHNVTSGINLYCQTGYHLEDGDTGLPSSSRAYSGFKACFKCVKTPPSPPNPPWPSNTGTPIMNEPQAKKGGPMVPMPPEEGGSGGLWGPYHK